MTHDTAEHTTVTEVCQRVLGSLLVATDRMVSYTVESAPLQSGLNDARDEP